MKSPAKINRIIKTLSVAALLTATFCAEPALSQQTKQITGFEAGTWNTVRLDDGVYWKRYLGDDLYDSKLSINLIEVWLDSSDVRFDIAFDNDSLHQTSRHARRNDALAAINGSFFNQNGGNPIPYLKIADKVISEGIPQRELYIENGAVAITSNGKLRIIQRPSQGWEQTRFPTVMSSGPMLVYDADVQTFGNDPFHDSRHPRTAVAITNDSRLYLVTIDGRSFQSYGMTIQELADFLKELGAVQALNLDGGGSTTMWVNAPGKSGIVNYPSDNLEFDHAGERQISNALLILN